MEKTGVLPSLSDLFKMTHASPDGVFVDPASEKLFNAVASRVEEQETQLTQQSADGLPVKLSTEKVDRIFEEVKFNNFNFFLYFIINSKYVFIYIHIGGS